MERPLDHLSASLEMYENAVKNTLPGIEEARRHVDVLKKHVYDKKGLPVKDRRELKLVLDYVTEHANKLIAEKRTLIHLRNKRRKSIANMQAAYA